jgi:kynureninase
VTRLIELARSEGLPVTAAQNKAERGGTVAINPVHAYEISRELIRRDFLVDYRPGAGIRVSPHFYTRDDEIEAVVHEVRSIIESRSFERHSSSRASVT